MILFIKGLIESCMNMQLLLPRLRLIVMLIAMSLLHSLLLGPEQENLRHTEVHTYSLCSITKFARHG